jgi:hypothetical protein
MPENPDWVHPLDAMAKREPLPRAAVRVIVLAVDDPARAEQIGDGLVRLLSQRGRKATSVVVRPDVHGWNRAFEHGLHGSDEPVVIATTATAPWSAAHLDPLLKAIDGRDHAIGCRPRPLLARFGRWLKSWPYRFLFAVPVADVYSPLRIHRREALAKIPLQSASRLVDVEILAKATFFVQTVEEVDVPDLPSIPVGPVGADLALLFSHPILRPEDAEPEGSGSRPAEPSEGQDEGSDSPGREDGEGHEDVSLEQRGPLEHHPAEGVEELRERQGLDERLDRLREPLGGEEQAAEDPHR